MGRTGSYLIAGFLGLVCILSGLRGLEVLAFGGMSAYNAGRITGSLLLSLLCGLAAKHYLTKARQAKTSLDRPRTTTSNRL